MADDARQCPVDGCPNTHSRDHLMCRTHWWSVPKELRDRVWHTYSQNGVLSEEYGEARDAAIAAAEQAET